MNHPIHIATTRRVKSGREAEFQEALREFFKTSFATTGVHGASMLVPPPGSTSPEFGILRTFANAQERDAFYASALFKAWEERIKPLTEGEPVQRELTGLEAWFRSPNPPPRWKMALATFLGVFPTAMILNLTLASAMRSWNFIVGNTIFNACMVALLTWVVMPLITRALGRWLHPESKQ
jgi:antibiotic biosynthesis monooxygenase (ABM) superfamily enzyme